MARFVAQWYCAIFLLLGIGGLFLGDAQPVSSGSAGGNFGSLTLHLTRTRDIVDVILLVLFIYVGFRASRSSGRFIMAAAGIFLLGLGILGFLHGDTSLADRPIANMNFPTLINLWDVGAGVLAILAALGTIDNDKPRE